MAQVSVVLPVFNIREDILHQCMESVLNQTYTDYEVILVDDGSDNGAEMICDGYAKRDERFRVIHQENRGVSAARNAGTATAKGKWLIYLDPDDWWEADTLEVLCRCMEEQEPDVLIFSYFDNFPDRQVERRCGKDPVSGYTEADGALRHNMQLGLLDESVRMLPGYFGAVWLQMINLEFLRRQHLLFPEEIRKSEDTVFNLRLLDAAARVGILDRSLYHYRRYEDSLCNRYSPDLEQTLAPVGKELYRFCSGRSEEYMQAYRVFLVKNYAALLRLNYFHPDNPDTEREKRRQWNAFLRTKDGFIGVEKTGTGMLYRRRKMTAVLYFVSFRLKSYGLLKLFWKLFSMGKEGHAPDL